MPRPPPTSPTFGVPAETPLERLVEVVRRPSVRNVLIVIVAVIVALTIHYRFFVLPTLTAKRYDVYLIGYRDKATIWVDPARQLVIVKGSAVAPDNFVVLGDRLYVPHGALDGSAVGDTWISFPLHDVFGDTLLFTADVVADSFGFGGQHCELPTKVTDAMVKLMIIQEFEPGSDPHRYNVCRGVPGGAFINGANIDVEPTLIRPDSMEFPPSDDVRDIERMGADADRLIQAARAAFGFGP